MTMRRPQVKINKRKKLLAFSYIQGKPVRSLDSNSTKNNATNEKEN